jgi:hypothetical protein
MSDPADPTDIVELRPRRHVATGKPRGRPKGSRNRRKPDEAPSPIKPAALRVANAAKYMDCSVSYVNKLIRQGRLEVAALDSPKLVLVRSIDRVLFGVAS